MKAQHTQIFWDTMKAVLMEKCTAPSATIKKFEHSHTNNLKIHSKALENKQTNKQKLSKHTEEE
jgi:hypothetical protein